MAIKPHDFRFKSRFYFCLVFLSLSALLYSCKKELTSVISGDKQNDEIAVLKSIYTKETSSKYGNKILSSDAVNEGGSLIRAKKVN